RRRGSRLPRRPGEERAQERAQVAAAAAGTDGSLGVLAHGLGDGDFLLAPVAEILVERHGLLLSTPKGLTVDANGLDRSKSITRPDRPRAPPPRCRPARTPRPCPTRRRRCPPRPAPRHCRRARARHRRRGRRGPPTWR